MAAPIAATGVKAETSGGTGVKVESSGIAGVKAESFVVTEVSVGVAEWRRRRLLGSDETATEEEEEENSDGVRSLGDRTPAAEGVRGVWSSVRVGGVLLGGGRGSSAPSSEESCRPQPGKRTRSRGVGISDGTYARQPHL